MRLLTTLPLALLAAPAAAQSTLQLPQLSPRAQTQQVVGLTNVTIDYHRPAVRERVIWGELVPYGKVWRCGANNATAIAFDTPMTVAGSEVPAGRYALFAVPGEKSWTLILNSVDEQWGAYGHDAKKDVVKFEVKPRAVPHREYMSFEVDPTGAGKAEVRLTWEKLQVAFELATDIHGIVAQRIYAALEQAGPTDGQLYMQAARYFYDNDLDAEQALAWVDTSVGIEQSSWNLELLARLLHRTGAREDAVAPMERAIELAAKAAPAEYVQGLEKTLADWKAQM